MSHVTREEATAAAMTLTGPILQVPPMVSAVQVGGRRLHELARQGIEVDRPPRPVTVHRFDVEPTGEASIWRTEVSCSSGTYVRALAADLGTALGGGAHLRRLRRVAIGPFTLEEAHTLEQLEGDPQAAVLAPARALAGHPTVSATPDVAAAVGHGRPLKADELGAAGTGPWAVLAGDGSLLAVYEDRGRELLYPAVVL
jgi:tRNA pseudouridine55 synthase